MSNVRRQLLDFVHSLIGIASVLLALRVGCSVFAEPSATDVANTNASAPATPSIRRVSHNAPARQRFTSANSFCTYYGSGRVAELRRFDIVIGHAPQMKSADVKQLSAEGVVTLGYLSVGEDSNLRDGNGLGPGGKASWYFDSDANRQPDQDPIWKSWYANANDPLWRADCVADAKRLVNEHGFDGVFLDLVSVCELYPESRTGMLQLIRDLREALPDAVIVMNQGFVIVADAAPIVDGIMIESFTATYDFDLKQYALNDPASLDFHLQRAVKVLQPVLKKHPLRVLVLDYANATDVDTIQFAANRAASLGFLFSVSPILLDSVYSPPPAGESNEKWLRMHSSRDALAVKLSNERNGFPSGTIVTPSGNFAGYTVEPLLDSEVDRSSRHWRKSSWASSEDGESAWVEFTLPTSREEGTLSVLWYDQAGPSRQFSVEVRNDPALPWQLVKSVVDNASRTSKIQLPRERFRQIRILQPPKGGSAGRPNLMWITKVELTDS